MLRTYATPLEVEVRRSFTCNYLLGLIVFFTVVSIVLVPIAPAIKMIACVWVLYAAYEVMTTHNQPKQLVWMDANQWLLKSNENIIKAKLLPSSYVSPWLTVLCFVTESNRKQSQLLFKDAVHPEQFRRLRVRLRMESSKLFM